MLQDGEMNQRWPYLFILILGLAAESTASVVGITTTSLPNGSVGTSYSAVIDASGGCTPYKWSIASGSPPTGLKTTASGTTTSLTLSGTPTAVGTYSFEVSVTGCEGYVSEVSYKLTISTVVGITTATLPNGVVDTSYSGVIGASGGCTPYTWAIVSGKLPGGVKATPSSSTTSLTFSGTPTAPGASSFEIAVTGCGGHVSEASYSVTIQTTSTNVVDLNWNASTSKEIAGYNVYRGPNGSIWTKINAALVASTLYDDSTVANGNTYYYAVTAVDIQGAESSKTAAVKAVIP
jgi:hypothetical protein